MQIFVKTLKNETIILDVNGADTIATLKEQIEKKGGQKAKDQRLLFTDVQLENSQTIESCKIQNLNTVEEASALNGGCAVAFCCCCI